MICGKYLECEEYFVCFDECGAVWSVSLCMGFRVHWSFSGSTRMVSFPRGFN